MDSGTVTVSYRTNWIKYQALGIISPKLTNDVGVNWSLHWSWSQNFVTFPAPGKSFECLWLWHNNQCCRSDSEPNSVGSGSYLIL
jgi:hypothetical protein